MRATPCTLFLVFSGLLLCTNTHAEQWPTKPVRFITVGAADAVPRILAQELSGPLGQQVIIDERAGASGTIGAEVASRAAPDGYTFLVATSTHMVTPHFYKLSYDFMGDFMPVSLAASTPFVLVSHPSLPVKTLADLVKLAKEKPGQLNFSATSAGSTTSLVAEMFKANAHINIVHVAYKSVAAALTDAVAGQVHLGMSVAPTALPQINARRVNALAVSSPKRSAVLPDVPTFIELGFPKVEGTGWFGVVALAKTNTAIVSRLSAEIVKILDRPEIKKRVLSLAMEPIGNTPEEFRAFIQADMARWAQAIKESNVKINVPSNR